MTRRTDAIPKVTESILLNYIGLQAIRYVYLHIKVLLRRYFYLVMFGKMHDRLVNRVVTEIDSIGYSCIELDEFGCDHHSLKTLHTSLTQQALHNQFKQAEKPAGEITTIYDADTVVHRISLKAQDLSAEDSSHLIYLNRLVYGKVFLSIISHFHGRSISRKDLDEFPVWFDRVFCGSQECAANQPHTDTFYPTLKIWIFPDGIRQQQSPLQFFPMTHRFTLKRMFFEYRKSIRYHLEPDYSWRLNESEIQDLHKSIHRPELLVNDKPFIVFANTHGFHNRYYDDSGSVRSHIHLSIRLPV